MCLQFLEEEGLHRYVDSKLLRMEIQESMDLTEEELERAAHELIHAGNGSPGGHPRPQYYEHLGGYGMHEMRDFNKYSQEEKPKRDYSQDYSTDDTDDMVYVTTL